MLPHEKLQVYAKAIDFVTSTFAHLGGWNKRHAVVDQFYRAAESLIFNLAEGARLRPGKAKLQVLDYSLGSAFKCAACLDTGEVKSFVNPTEVWEQKQRLREVIMMLIGLSKAWDGERIHEDSSPYAAEVSGAGHRPLFSHETLDVYSAGLELMRWADLLPGGRELPTRWHRQIDESATGILLNIAEGNGRYSQLDHARFLEIASSAAVKVAAGLDLGVRRGLIEGKTCGPAKRLLERIVAMLWRMS